MKVYFLRHGATKLNLEGKLNGQIDEPLAPEGFEQARAAALAMPASITHIYASSMLRARQTAQIVGDTLGIPITTHNALREINMGSIAGRAWSAPDLGQRFKQIHRSMQFDYRDIGGESAQEFTARVKDFAHEINGTHQDYEALLIAHGGVQRLLQLLQSGSENLAEIENAVLLEFNFDQVLAHTGT